MTLTQRRHVAVYRYAMVIMLYIISNYSSMPPPRGHTHDGNHLLETGNGEKKPQMANLCHKQSQHGYNLIVYVYSSLCSMSTLGLTRISWSK